MSDNSTEPTPPAEAGTPNTVTNVSGEVNIGGEFAGQDKIVHVHEALVPIATSWHQLLPSPFDFTGRETKLAELMSKAETDSVTISGLQDMSGTGRTVLVLVQTDFSLTLTQYGHRMGRN